jgi:hypothetical protein
LGAAEFTDREAATKALREYGDVVLPALQEALKGDLSAEQRTRLAPLMTAAGSWLLTGERAGQVRAVAVLERVGTADARDALVRLAGGVADARLTREAAAALGRFPTAGSRGDTRK